MKVVVLAATGQVGRTVLSELISRGHQVTAVARTPDKLPNSIHTVRDELGTGGGYGPLGPQTYSGECRTATDRRRPGEIISDAAPRPGVGLPLRARS